MQNKIFNYFLQIANFCFLLGIVITAIFFINQKNAVNSANIINGSWAIFLTPYIIFMIISLVFATLFAFHRKNYFILISAHISKKCVYYYQISVYLLFFNIFVSIVLLFGGILGLINANKTEFLINAYFYIVIAIEIILTFIDVILDAISKLKIKVDLAIKRGGVEKLLEQTKENENGNQTQTDN